MNKDIQKNKKDIVVMLNNQVKEGIKIANDLTVDNNIYGIILTNLLNAFKASEQMGAEIEFDEAQEKMTKQTKPKEK